MTSVELSYPRVLPRLVLLAASVFIVSTNGLLVAGIIGPLGRSFAASTTEVGYTITWYSASVAILSPVLAIALARVPRGVILGAALLVFAVGAAVAAASTSLTLFIAGRVLAAVGAAAIMPTSLAVAASIARPERRGTALAITTGGFTLAAGLGAPAATVLASVGGWRAPIWTIAGLAVVLAVAVLLAVRDVPIPPPLTLVQRFAPLRDARLLFAVGATMFAVAGFNVLYIFLGAESVPTIGHSLSGLAGLQLVLGIAGIVATVVIGPVVDRIGTLPAGVATLGLLLVAGLVLPVAEPSLAATVVVLAAVGLAGGSATIPIQHRLVSELPEHAGIALSWTSTALYLGIAIAPIVGGIGLRAGGGGLTPLVAAGSAAVALAAFVLGAVAVRGRADLRSRRSPDPAARPAEG